jgi:hypothetical protein
LVVTLFSEDGRKPRKILVKTDRVTINDVTPDIVRTQKTGGGEGESREEK